MHTFLSVGLSFPIRLLRILLLAGTLGAPLASYAHTYDSRGDLATLTNLTGTKSFAYDPDERLTYDPEVIGAARPPRRSSPTPTIRKAMAPRADLSIERMRTLGAQTLEAVKDDAARRRWRRSAKPILDSIRVARMRPGMRSMAFPASG